MADYRNQNNRNRGQLRPITDEERRRRAARARAAKKRKRQKLITRLIALLIVIVIVVVGVLVLVNAGKKSGADTKPKTEQSADAGDETGDIETDENGEPVTEEANDTTEISLIAVGDVIGHDTILEMCNTGSGYDFTSMFEKLKPEISKADIAVVNMETPFGGPDAGPYIGYPAFNTPDEMGLALIDAGFDVVQLASNHTMDSGTIGLDHEMEFWGRYTDRIKTIGVFPSEEAKNTPVIVEKDGIKVAFLNYTYGLNGYELPADRGYMMTLLEDGNRDVIRSQIEAAKAAADIVVVCPHWGTEYMLKTSDSMQNSWAELFTEAGADVIIGTHPHVIQKIDWVEAGGNKALCYYSIGNFCSNQQDTENVLGGMTYVKIVKDADGVHVDENESKVIPVVTQNDKTGTPIKIYSDYLANYTEDLASVHDVKYNSDPEFSKAKLEGIADDVWGSAWIKDRID